MGVRQWACQRRRAKCFRKAQDTFERINNPILEEAAAVVVIAVANVASIVVVITVVDVAAVFAVIAVIYVAVVAV